MEEALFPGLLLLLLPMGCSTPRFPVLPYLPGFPGLPDCSILLEEMGKQCGHSVSSAAE